MDEKFERHEIDMDLLNKYLEDKDYLKLKNQIQKYNPVEYWIIGFKKRNACVQVIEQRWLYRCVFSYGKGSSNKAFGSIQW